MRRLFLVSLLLISGLFFTFSLASLSHQSAEAGSNVPGLANPSALVSPSPLISLTSPSVLPSLVIRQEPTGDRGISRRAPSINGRLEGSIQQLTPENVTLNGGATITEKLYVPGTPTVRRNGNPNFGGVIEGSGSAIPTNYQVTLNGNATLGNLVNRTNPVALTPVPAPPTPTGTRDVSLNNPNDQIGDFATLRNLTLNGNAGTRSVPPGTYGNFTVNGSSVLIFGIANATEPASYNLQGLTLNGGTQLQIVGPVTLTLRNGTNINGTIGNAANPLWLTLNVSNGGVTLNGGSQMFGKVNAPTGSVTVNSRLTGNIICDRLTVNGGGVVSILSQAPQDTTAPVITLAEPVQGLITKTSPVTVSGTVTDASAVTVTVNGQPVPLSGTQITASVALTEGPNTITVLATDTFGNVGTASRNVTLDTISPVLTITAPQDGSATTETQLTITGTVTDTTTTTVTVNNVAATRNGNEFSAVVSLLEGSNTFVIRAEDAAGNQTEITRTVTLQVPHDTTPPVITLTEPAEGLITNALPVTVSGTVTDASAVTVTVNNQPATLSGTQFSASLTLTEGSNTITVSATDAFGNASNTSQSVILDTVAPVLTVTSPQDGSTTTEAQITVTGSVTDTTTISVTVNNIAATLTGNEFSAIVPLVEGSTTLLVRAVDAAGNQTELTRLIILATEPPLALTVYDPEEALFTNSTPTKVYGFVKSSNLTSVTVTVNGIELTLSPTAVFTTQIPLQEGANEIRIVAHNSTNQSVEVVRTVTLDTTPPTISGILPIKGTVIDGPTVDIQGVVSDSSPINTVIVDETTAQVTNGTGTQNTFIAKDVPIDEHSNYISIAAFDAAGNSTLADVTVIGKDRTPPEPPTIFPITSPTRLSFQSIEGRAEPGSKVTIVGGVAPVTVDAIPISGLFVAQVNLTTGVNMLSITSKDAGGNISPAISLSIESNPALPPLPPGQAWQINTASGNAQRGLINTELPRPLVAIVTDSTGAPVSGVNVTFKVLQGGGKLVGGNDVLTVATNSQGYAVARFIPGSDSGIPTIHLRFTPQIIRADFEGNTSSPTIFLAQGIEAEAGQPTQVSGDVLDQNLRGLPNALIRLGGQQTQTREDGSFVLTNVASGPHQVLEVIGRDHINLPGRWPNISFDIDVLPGINNRFGRPLFLPRVNEGSELPLDANHIVTEDRTYELPVAAGEASIQVTVRQGTQVLFPPDISDKRFSVTRIPVNRVPMALEDGRATNLYISVQPSGTIFDPPLEVTFPNLDQQPPNAQVLLMSFDHDAGRYVRVGTGHVSTDGRTVTSDSGSGIRVGAWHGFPPVPPVPETDGTGGGGDSPTNCDAWFCGVPATPLGSGFYRAQVPATYGACNFEAKCRCQAPQDGSLLARQSGGSQPICEVRIKLAPGIYPDVKDVSNDLGVGTDVLVGHRIQLTAEIKGLSGTVEFEKWFIPGKRIRTYLASRQTGKVYDLSIEDYNQRSINFCWVDDGAKEVVYTIVVNGRVYSAKANFNVLAPDSDIKTVTTQVTVDTNFEPLNLPLNPRPSLHFGNTNINDEENPAGFKTTLGITFERTTDPESFPPNFATGNKIKYLQIGNTVFRSKATDGWYKEEFIGLDVLPNAKDWPYTTIDPKNSDIAGDAPAFGLDFYRERGCSEVELTYGLFEMYTMFQPFGAGSIWVPLHKVDWDWKGTAKYDDATGKWSGTGTNKPNPISSETTLHPEWTKRIGEKVDRVKE